MKKMTLAFLLAMVLFPTHGISTASHLDILAGQYLVEKLVRSPKGEWEPQVSDSSLGNHFYVIENKALLVIEGKEYPFPISEPKYRLTRLETMDIFNPINPKAIRLEDLGYSYTQYDYVFEFKESVPFEQMIALDRFSRLLITMNGTPYLLIRLFISPNNFDAPPAHYDRAWALLKDGSPAEAIEEFKKVLKADPNYADAYYGWAAALEDSSTKDQKSQWDLEIKLLEKAMKLIPENERNTKDDHRLKNRHMTVYEAAKDLMGTVQTARSRPHGSEL